MAHNKLLREATVVFYGTMVKLECNECGYRTNINPYGEAFEDFTRHWNQNQPRCVPLQGGDEVMAHNRQLESASIKFHGLLVELECDECGYSTDKAAYNYAFAALTRHWKRNQSS